jgi:signal transduction histidine kinase
MEGAWQSRHYTSFKTCGGQVSGQRRAPPRTTDITVGDRRQLVSTGLAIVKDRPAAHRLEVELNLLRYIFAQAPAPITVLDGPDHKFSLVNEACLRLFGRRERNHLLGRPIRNVFPELAGQAFTEVLDRVYLSGQSHGTSPRDLKLLRPNREQILYLHFTCLPIRDVTSTVNGILCHFVDVTPSVLQKAEFEERLNECTTELEKSHASFRVLSRHSLRIQEEERRRLGIELHDRAGQLLAAIKWKLDLLHRDIGAARPDLDKFAKDALQLANELSHELRTVSHSLHPPLLEEAGLELALRLYIEGLRERGGFAVELEIHPGLQPLPPEMDATIFRIVQESLTNVYRHANTRAARVRISSDTRMVKVQVLDRGRGIPSFTSVSDPNARFGVGIRGMRERIRQLNGHFDIESSRGSTTVTAVLPIEQVSDNPELATRKRA